MPLTFQLSPVRMASSPPSSSPSSSSRRINANRFYTTYSGHPPSDISRLLAHLSRSSSSSPRIYLVGDSTLDNKFWLPSHRKPSPVSYLHDLLDGNFHKRDIAHYLNLTNNRFITVNCAVEASTLHNRRTQLLEHDKLVRDNLSSEDVLVISIGGNDIALTPSFSTIISVLLLVHFNFSPAMRHFENLFGTQIKEYIEKLVSKTRPRLVVICMLYYFDQNPTPSWASFTLNVLSYTSRPQKVQRAIRRIYEQVISTVQIDGVSVVTCPFFRILDGTCTHDYVERVEPSEQGGEKMALYLSRLIDRALHTNAPKE